MYKTIRKLLIATAAILPLTDAAAEPLQLRQRYEVSAQGGSGDFAPYYQASNRDGMTGVSPWSVTARYGIFHPMNDSTRFSYGFGASLMAGYVSKTDYDRYSAEQGWYSHGVDPNYVAVDNLYGEIKWRSLFLEAGIRPYDKSLFDSGLGTGDWVLSRNALPVPQIRLGFNRFVDVPFTRGWLQIQGELAYGIMTDSRWIEDQYNRYTSFMTTGVKIHHKRFYFRVADNRPVTLTIGMQHAAQFGGTKKSYRDGELMYEQTEPGGFKEAMKMFIPKQGEGYYGGNHLGAWDVLLSWKTNEKTTLRAYCQLPWEDGSGIGKLNGWDGVWGIEYRRTGSGPVDGAVVEYIDLTNQSGPMHFAPGDFPDCTITGAATGADDYYNNYFYDGWANYGMSLGSPFVKSPAYNLNGYPQFSHNRLRGFHAGVKGEITAGWRYTFLISHRTSWGTPYIPSDHRLHSTSMMAQAQWTPTRMPKIKVTGSLAFDHGRLYGDNFGINLSVAYSTGY